MALKNPNAAAGTIASIGGGEVVVNIAKALGYNISTGWGIAIAGALTGLVLFIGREGLTGVWHLIWRGNKPAAPPAPPPAAAPPPG